MPLQPFADGFRAEDGDQIDMSRTIVYCTLAVCFLFSHASGQTPDKGIDVPVAYSFAANEYFAKGGIGIVNSNLYIDVASPKNELRLPEGNKWTGKDAPKPEVVIFFASKIWSTHELPGGFDITHA